MRLRSRQMSSDPARRYRVDRTWTRTRHPLLQSPVSLEPSDHSDHGPRCSDSTGVPAMGKVVRGGILQRMPVSGAIYSPGYTTGGRSKPPVAFTQRGAQNQLPKATHQSLQPCPLQTSRPRPKPAAFDPPPRHAPTVRRLPSSTRRPTSRRRPCRPPRTQPWMIR